ncbi:MAG: phosphoribosyl-ATP diphosphatase [Egibacteraceae bacterium]
MPPQERGEPLPAGVLSEVEAVLRDRLDQPPAGSYSATLLGDPELASRKIMEEAFELCLELGRRGADTPDRRRVAEEAADVLFHVLAGIVGAGVSLQDVFAELEARRG